MNATAPLFAEVVSESPARPAGPSLESLAESFAEYVDAAPSTVSCYAKNIGRFIEWLRGRGIEAPTAQDVVAYKKFLVSTKKDTTASSYLTAVRVFFKWTAKLPEGRGRYPNIAEDVKGVKQDRGHRKGHFTSRQVRKILEEAHGETVEALRNYALLSLLFGTGLRTVEVARANIEDLRPLGDTMVLFVQGKGRKSKSDYVKIPPKLEDAIRAYLVARGPVAPSDPLFASLASNFRGHRLPSTTISQLVKSLFRRAGFDSPLWTAHACRHTAATGACMAGHTLVEVQKMLRHSDPKTTEIYMHNIDRLSSQCEEDLVASFML